MYGKNILIPLIAAGLLIALAIYYYIMQPEGDIWVYMIVGALLNLLIVFRRRRTR
jgi:hypothetical protein